MRLVYTGRVGLGELVSTIRADAEDWAQKKSWLWRFPLLCYLAYAGIRHLKDPEYSSLLGGITFSIHELGHLLFSFDGTFLMIAGGTLCQLAAPLVAGLVLLRQRDYFGVTFAGSWFCFSLVNATTYLADARTQKLPLLGLSADPTHDWNYMLRTLHLLPYDLTIALFLRVFSFLLLVSCLTFGAWLCWKMYRSRTT